MTSSRVAGAHTLAADFFHNAHQPKLGDWPWIQTGPANLRLFLEKAAKAGFFVDLRIGPCVKETKPKTNPTPKTRARVMR